MKVFTFFSAILFVFTSYSFSQEYPIYPTGDIKSLSASDIKEHEKKGGFYNEFWNYHIALENGSEIYLTYSINHFGGLRNAVSGARMSLLNWNGKNYSAAREYDLEKLVFEEEPYRFMLNTERGIWFEGKLPDEHKVHFRTNKNGTHFDINLDFIDAMDGFTWGDGIFDLDENNELALFTHIPFSKISGFIALDYDTVEIKGIGFMNHTYQTNVGTRLFEKSFKYIHSENGNYAAGYFLIPKDNESKVVGYAFEGTGNEITLKKPISVQVQSTDTFLGEKISERIKICYESSPCEILEIETMYEKIAMLEELGGIKKMLAKRFLGGDIIELRGSAKRNGNENVFYSLTKLD
ncbi:MAG: hypothetical protein RLN90_12960 [Balneolaceae bacterium]